MCERNTPSHFPGLVQPVGAMPRNLRVASSGGATATFADAADAVASGRLPAWSEGRLERGLWEALGLGWLTEFCKNDRGPRIFLNGQGSVTPLHRDQGDLLVLQVLGTKDWHLFSPTLTPCIDPSLGRLPLAADLSALDAAQILRRIDGSGLMRHAMRVELKPGDALFLPSGWWHEVKAATLSMSLTITGPDMRIHQGRLAFRFRRRAIGLSQPQPIRR